MKELFIIRGVSGSGKSTLAKAIGGIHVEADQYFTDKDGNYEFNPSQISNAHNYCQSQVEAWMSTDGSQVSNNRIVVSNTFTREWEIEPYFKLAEKYGYRVYTLISENRFDGVNIHNVPEATLTNMRNRFEIKL